MSQVMVNRTRRALGYLVAMSALVGLAEARATAQTATQATTVIPSAELRRRIESITATSAPEVARNAALAVLAEHRASRDPLVRISACTPDIRERHAQCDALLLAIANDTTARWETRVEAAVWLPMDDKTTGPLLDSLIGPATPAQLGEVVEALGRLPEPRAVPPLLQVLFSDAEPARLEAVRALTRFVSSNVTDALYQVRAAASPGTPIWLETTLAVARQGAPTIRQQLTVLSPYYGTSVGVAELLFEFGDPQGEPLLRRAAATADPATAVRAAFALRTMDPDVLPKAVQRALVPNSPGRLVALKLAREARLPLPAAHTWLLDADPHVRVAAAVYLLSVAAGGSV